MYINIEEREQALFEEIEHLESIGRGNTEEAQEVRQSIAEIEAFFNTEFF